MRGMEGSDGGAKWVAWALSRVAKSNATARIRLDGASVEAIYGMQLRY